MDTTPSEEGAPPLSFDPTDGTLPPWLWLTLTTLILFCLLFISFRRAKSIELYHKSIEYLKSKLPSSLPRTFYDSSRRGINLSTPPATFPSSSTPTRRTLPRSHSFSSDSSTDSSSQQLNNPNPNNTDELPLYTTTTNTTPTSLRIASFQRRGQSMLESFSEQVVEGGKRVIGGLGWGENGGGGVGKLLLGSRDVDKGLGRIRLGDEREGERGVFELGEEGEIEDAVELPRNQTRYT